MRTFLRIRTNPTAFVIPCFSKQEESYLPQVPAQYQCICRCSGSSQGVFPPFGVAAHAAECRASWRKASSEMTRGHLRKCVMRCESVANMSDPGVLTASALSSLCGRCQDAPAVQAVCPARPGIHYTHLTSGWNAGPPNEFQRVAPLISRTPISRAGGSLDLLGLSEGIKICFIWCLFSAALFARTSLSRPQGLKRGKKEHLAAFSCKKSL